jgi:uncharacterized protein with NRDE domain
MCVSAIAIGLSRQWPLVIAGNRDEFLDRPTQALHEWHTPAGTPVWGGRDELDGGGWMLMSRDGSAAALVTNVRDANLRRGELSRGQLTLDWIDAVAQGQTDRFWDALEAGRYGGFNLVCGQPDRGQWWYFSNRTAGGPQALGAGLYGVSNARLDTPWPKTQKLKAQTRQALQAERFEDMPELLLRTLTDTTAAQPEDLPDTGVGLEAERRLSSVFIEWPERAYGTRSSHVLAMGQDMRSRYWEASYPTEGISARQSQPRVHSLL